MHGFGLGLYGKIHGNVSVGAFFLQLGDNCLSLFLVIWLFRRVNALAHDRKVLQVEGAFFLLEAGFEGGQPQVS